MKTTNFFSVLLSAMMLVSIIAILTGCAAKKNIWGDPDKGLVLEYRMPDSQLLRYNHTTEYSQEMEVRGQQIELNSNSGHLFTIEPKGTEDGNNKMNVTIDSIYIEIDSPQGKVKADMGSVIGQHFDFLVSVKGEELDYSGAEDLKYSLGNEAELNIASDFQTLFPNLPNNPIRVGDSWTSIDTLLEKSGSGYLRIVTIIDHTLEGLEKYMGYDCIKVQSSYSGSMEGSSETQGIKLTTTGNIEGTGTWYFAYKEGLFVKMISKGKANSTTKAMAEKEIIIPGSRDYAMVTELVR